MQYEGRWRLCCQCQVDGVEVFRALGQHQNLAALLEGPRDLGGDGLSPGRVIGKVPEHVLNPRRGRQVDAGKP